MTDLSSHGIVALVRDEGGRFLLVREARDQMRGRWAPPHGRTEPADGTEEAAVVREVHEETGLTVQPIGKLLTQAADTKVKTVSFWLVEVGSGEVRLNEESSEFGWFSLDEARKLELYPGTKIFFDKVAAGEISLN